MAVKGENDKTATGASGANVAQAGAAPQAGNGGGEATSIQTTPKRRGRAKGMPAGPRLLWPLERDQALASILQVGYTKQEDGSWAKDPGYNGSTKTAASVAEALATHPAFANAEAPVTPARVKAHLDSVIASKKKDGKPVHEWLLLTVSRSRINTEVFD